VAAVERAAAHLTLAPTAPDLENVEPATQLVAPGPEGVERTADLPACIDVRSVGVVVVRRAGAVVLAHRVDRRGSWTAAR
jgi:hypothetical protein